MQDSAPILTPFAIGCHSSHQQSPTTPEERTAYEEYVNGFKYIEGIGAVLYATQTRPDIQHAVGVLAKFGACPGKPHLKAFKRVLRYLKGTVRFGLRLGGKDDGIDLIGCVRGHPSFSLLPLSSPTLHLFIYIPPPHLCTSSKDHTSSRRLPGPIVRQLPRSQLTNSR
jgi:hypothetical protein